MPAMAGRLPCGWRVAARWRGRPLRPFGAEKGIGSSSRAPLLERRGHVPLSGRHACHSPP